MDERRRRRSSDPLVALHYQLSSARSPVCEELAAYAPLLADGDWSSMSNDVSSRVEALRHEVNVRTVNVAGQDVLLCTRQKRRDPQADQFVDQAARGITRILQEAAA